MPEAWDVLGELPLDLPPAKRLKSNYGTQSDKPRYERTQPFGPLPDTLPKTATPADTSSPETATGAPAGPGSVSEVPANEEGTQVPGNVAGPGNGETPGNGTASGNTMPEVPGNAKTATPVHTPIPRTTFRVPAPYAKRTDSSKGDNAELRSNHQKLAAENAKLKEQLTMANTTIQALTMFASRHDNVLCGFAY